MLYFGIGNAGSQILYHHYENIRQLGEQYMSRQRFALADADSNNPIIYAIGKMRDKGFTDIELLPFDRYWNGGCGVYHIIGELLVARMESDAQLTHVVEEFAPTADQSQSVFFVSAGGGTGGGVGMKLAYELVQRPQRRARIYAVSPEVDQFEHSSGSAARIIGGQDGFQCAAAGRLFVKYFDLKRRSKMARTDLLVTSNSYLSSPPDGVSYRDAVRRLDDFISKSEQLLSQTDFVAPGNEARFMTFGYAATRWNEVIAGGTAEPAEKHANRLLERLFAPLNLASNKTFGLSAVPYELGEYENDHKAHFEGNRPKARLARALGQSRNVYVNCFFKEDDKLGKEVQDELKQAITNFLGVSTPVTFSTCKLDSSKTMPSLEPTDEDKCSFAAVMVLEDPIVGDVFKLVVYYLMSAFEWKRGAVQEVQALVHECLKHNSKNARDFIRQRVLDSPGAGKEQSDRRVHLEEDAKEVYVEQLWGNYSDIKAKVLQRLGMEEDSFELLGVEEIVNALSYLNEQIHFRDPK